ncbi:MAG: prepilin peptidase [Dehalococcoidia bacterium]|nr:prepilin peptidase [Dehalococcoidia bacterium]
MQAAYISLFAVLGLAIGSFLNVCIDRLPRKESILNPPSYCEACHHRLAAKDLIPILSYLRLRGRCRYCQAPVPRRLLWVELATSGAFALLYWQFGLTSRLGTMLFYACLFIIIFFVDLNHKLILNKVVYPGMLAALLFAVFLPQPWLTQWVVHDVANFALGAGIGFGIFLLLAIVSRGGMGWGDVKLAALIGLATGFPLVFVALITGAILGGLVAIVLLISKKRGRKEMIAFGPFLSLTAMITLAGGSNILNWYLGL